MPTTRRRRTRQIVPPVSPALRDYLLTGDYTASHDDAGHVGAFDVFLKNSGDGAALRADWLAVRDELLGEWVAAHPGTRPWAWWAYDAPRWRREDQPACVRTIAAAADCGEPRRRLGGVGTPNYEALNYLPRFAAGIPVDWVSPWDVTYYTGLAGAVDGEPVRALDRYACRFSGVAPDPHDPPTFESEAGYLDRHGLLTAAERRRLPATAFDPDVLEIDADTKGTV